MRFSTAIRRRVALSLAGTIALGSLVACFGGDRATVAEPTAAVSGTGAGRNIIGDGPTANCVAVVAVQGVPITPVTFVASGGEPPYVFSATGLPNGITLSPTGTLSGTPTVSGSFNYTVTIVDDFGNTSSGTCTIVVSPPPQPPVANCVAVTAVQNVAITPVQLTASGGTAPYTFSASGLPAGLSVSSTGLLSGTPTVSGTFTYTVTATDANGQSDSSEGCTVTVNVRPSANCVAITAWKNVPITPVTMIGSGGVGGPYTFSATGLPPGLTMSSTGTISGTPTSSGTFSYTVTVTDAAGNTGTVNCSVLVKYDGTNPVCAVYANASPPYMTYSDAGGSGIVRLVVNTNLNNNYRLNITPFPGGTTIAPSATLPAPLPAGTNVYFPSPQTGTITITATRISSSKSSQLTVTAYDAVGRSVVCDPIETTLTRLKQDDGVQTFTDVPYAEHFVTIENGGLKSIDIVVNGTTFKVKRLSDDEVRVVNIKSAMKLNNKNTITLVPKGKKGESADITIGPEGPGGGGH